MSSVFKSSMALSILRRVMCFLGYSEHSHLVAARLYVRPGYWVRGVVNAANSERDEADQIIFCVDGVHGFGIEDEDLKQHVLP